MLCICNTFTPQIKSSGYAKHKIIHTSDFINSFCSYVNNNSSKYSIAYTQTLVKYIDICCDNHGRVIYLVERLESSEGNIVRTYCNSIYVHINVGRSMIDTVHTYRSGYVWFMRTCLHKHAFEVCKLWKP